MLKSINKKIIKQMQQKIKQMHLSTTVESKHNLQK